MTNDLKILYVEDEDKYRTSVLELLGIYNYIESATTFEAASELIGKNRYDVILLDKLLGERNGLDLIPEIKIENPNTVIVVLTADGDPKSATKCMLAGADDYIVKSGNIAADLFARISVAISRAASERHLVALQRQIKESLRYELIGQSEANIRLRAEILGLRGFSSNVLVTGESGTGKELVARMLNAIEGKRDRPFEAMNCAAIPPQLVESTLFGHKKGSFTDAKDDKPGKFELAHEGDLFLDEVGDLSLDVQAKLLRVLQEGEFQRVGCEKTIRASCRVIAATNKNLESLTKKGLFRSDLYYRLNVVRLRTTPLRQRMEDIPELARVFLVRLGQQQYLFSEAALARLMKHEWPGNIRELGNVVERAVISCKRRNGVRIGTEDITIDSSDDEEESSPRHLESLFPDEPGDLSPDVYREYMEAAERSFLRRALKLSSGNVPATARALGISRPTMFRRIQDLGIDRPMAAGLRTDGSRIGEPVFQSDPVGRTTV